MSFLRRIAVLALAIGMVLFGIGLTSAGAQETTPCGDAPAGMNVIVSDDPVIVGTDGDDFICAGHSDNEIRAGGGDDIIFGRGGNDFILGRGGDDTIDGGEGNDNLRGSYGDDTIMGQQGNDRIQGGDGNDRLEGSIGNDRMVGGNGSDIAYGGTGDDRVFGRRSADTLHGDEGNDRIVGGVGTDSIFGGDGSDSLSGGFGDDDIAGGAGDDILQGADGEDSLVGGLGIDNANGGADADMCTTSETYTNCEDGTDDLDDLDGDLVGDIIDNCNGVFNPGQGDRDRDGIGDACDGFDDRDNDNDGFRVGDGDCNDGNPAINPGAEEIVNDGIDQDCDGEDLTNSAPTVEDGLFEIEENLDDGTIVGTIDAGDADEDTLTLSISGPGSDFFTIDPSTGEITSLVTFDHETDGRFEFEVGTIPEFIFTVSADDGIESTDAQVTIEIIDVNESPSIEDAGFAIDENEEVGTVVGSLDFGDPDEEDVLTLAIVAGDEGEEFSIDSEGVITTNGPLDFEATGSYTLTVEVSDSGELSATATVTVTVNDVNEAPIVEDASFEVDENESGVEIGTVTGSDEDGDILEFAIIAGDAGNLFDIAPDGAISVQTALDHEEQASYELTVEVTDDGGLKATATVTIDVIDVNEAPSIADDEFDIDENEEAGTVVGSLDFGDPDAEDVLTLAITAGDVGEEFSIDSEGVITTNGPLDFEATGSYTLTVEVSDSGELSAAATVTVTVNDVNEAPIVEDASFEVDENVSGVEIGTVTGSDEDGDILEFAIIAGDAGNLFDIAPDGAISVQTALDHEEQASYELTVEVTDDGGLKATATVTIDVIDVNEAPSIADDEFAVDENSKLGTSVGSMSFDDPDFEDSLTFGIEAGADGDSFDIDNTGAVTTAAELDFETKATYTFTVTIADLAGETDQATVVVTVNDVNDAPVVDEASFEVDENSDDGTVVGTVTGSDEDGDTLSFSIEDGNKSGAFEISEGGVITVANPPGIDHEDTPAYELTVVASDGVDSGSAPITITIGDVDEQPVIEDQTMSVDENTPTAAVIAPVEASDPEEAPLAFGIIAGNNAGTFTIDSNTGELKVANGTQLDYETDPITHTLTVQVSDGTTPVVTATVTVNVNDVNEAPELTVGETYSIDENSDSGTAVTGDDASATDVDADDTLTFSITSGNDAGNFTIDGETGAISVATEADINFEVSESFTLEITVTDSGDLTDSADITVTVNDLNDAPVLTVDADGYSVAENSALPAAVTGTTTADDEDEDTLTFSISGTDAGLFQIDETNGALTYTGGVDQIGLDLETTASYSLTIDVSDGELSDSTAITVDVINENEAPELTVGETYSVDENSEPATIVTGDAATATDVDADDELTFSLSGPGSDQFGIDGDGVISVGLESSLDFETTSSYTFDVVVTDLAGLTDSAEITIEVSDVNEAPELTVDPDGYSVAENSEVDTPLAGDTPTATDVDEDTLTFSITAGNTDDVLAIDPDTGALTVAGPLNFDETPSYELTIQVSDGELIDTAEGVVVTIEDLNEAPELTVDEDGYSIDENSEPGSPLSGATPTAVDMDVNDTMYFSIGGRDAELFVIDESTGELTLAAGTSFDFEEDPTSYSIDITVSDREAEGLSDTAAGVVVEVNDVNEAPEIESEQVYELPFDSQNLDTVGFVAASDVDAGDSLTWGITNGNPNGVFAIVGATGEIRLADVTTLELDQTYVLTIKVTDTGGLIDTDTVTILVNRTPSVEDAGFSVAENSDDGTVVGAVVASDPDGQALTYTITSGDDEGSFAIDANGELTVNNPPGHDFETTSEYTLEVTVNDSGAGDLSDTATVTVDINDVNEAPVLTVGETYSVDENSGNDTVITGDAADATDVDADDTLTFSLSGDDAASFDIDGEGVISVDGEPGFDFETGPQSYTFNVVVTDFGGLSDEAAVTVTINDVNEAPVLTVPEVAYTVAENEPVDTAAAGDLPTADDEDDGDNAGLMYSITAGNTGNAFSIERSTGALTTNGPLDHESDDNPYTLDITVTDEGGLTDTEKVQVDVTDVNEAPEIATGQSYDVSEHAENPFSVGFVEASDVDDNALTWSITSGNGAGVFAMAQATGELTINDGSTLEVDQVFNLEITVEDAEFLVVDTVDVNIVADFDADLDPDATDPDDDNDGTPDEDDAFPFDPNEDTDTDGDGTGDNADTDADGDTYERDALIDPDCDDLDASINPGAEDVPDDGIDQDCDGEDATANGSIILTSDNEIYEVYVNGIAVPLGPNAANWGSVDTLLTSIAPGDVVAVKASDWDGYGWVGVHLETSGGDTYGANDTDGFIWVTSPIPANSTPAADPADDGEWRWFDPEFDDSGWAATPGGSSLGGQYGFPATSPAEQLIITGQTAWLRFVVPNPV